MTEDEPKRVRGKPFEKGNPGRPIVWTPERVLPALKSARGNYTKAARILSEKNDGVACHRNTIRRLVNEYPELRRACEEAWIAALETMHDKMTEAAIEKGDQRAQALLLTRFHPGYRQKQEITGPGGGPIQVAAKAPANPELDEKLEGVDLKLLTRSEEIQLASLVYAWVKHPPLDQEQADRMAILIDKGRGSIKQIELKSEDEV